jgi:hypothetical protein
VLRLTDAKASAPTTPPALPKLDATAWVWCSAGLGLHDRSCDWSGCDAGMKARPIPDQPEPRVGQSLFSRRAHQRDRGAMAHKLWQLRIVPKPQREHVAGATDDDPSHQP